MEVHLEINKQEHANHVMPPVKHVTVDHQIIVIHAKQDISYKEILV